NWFDQVTSGVSKDWHTRAHLRDNARVAGKPAEKMFFSAMDFHRLNPAEHLVRFPKEATDRNPQTLIDLSTFLRKQSEDDHVKPTEHDGRRKSYHRLHQKERH